MGHCTRVRVLLTCHVRINIIRPNIEPRGPEPVTSWVARTLVTRDYNPTPENILIDFGFYDLF